MDTFFQSEQCSNLEQALAGWASRHPVDGHLLKKMFSFSYKVAL